MKAKQLAMWARGGSAAWAFGVFICAQSTLAAPTQWTALYNRGQPLATYVVGDVLDYPYEFAINTDTSGWGVEYGLGTTTDGTDWSWRGADWSRMDGDDNRVWISKPYEHQFTSAGTWYCAGRFMNGGDTYYAATDWTANGGEPLAAESYFQVNELSVPAYVVATPKFDNPATRAGISCMQPENRGVLVTMSSDMPTGSPEPGVLYLINDTFGNQTVVGTGSGWFYGEVPGLMPGQTYYFTFYAENMAFYSEGWTESCTMGYPQACNTDGGAPETPTQVFLGDSGLTFGCDTWGTLEGNWGRVRMWLAPNPDPSSGFAGEWSEFTDAEHKTCTSPWMFDSLGIWSWGIQVDYGAPYGDDFWYLTDQSGWFDIGPFESIPYGPVPTVTVLPLNDPSNCVATRSAFMPESEVELAWSLDAQGHDVVVMCKPSSSGVWMKSEDLPRGPYYIGMTFGDCTVVYVGPDTSAVATGLDSGMLYDFKFYSENNGYLSPGVEQQASTFPYLPLEITTQSLPLGMVGTPYGESLVASNGVVPYTWSTWSIASSVLAWGWNYYGQCTVPNGLSNVLAVAAGGNHSLALKSDGTVVAWGDNSFGQTNVPAGLQDIVAVAAGANHCLALKSNGRVVAWGENNFGQATVPEGLGNVVAIAGGWAHSLALKSDGTLVIWGGTRNDNGQCRVPAGLSNVIGIASLNSHNVALKSDGTVFTWGSQTNVPAGLSNVTAVAAGVDISMALKSDGTVVAWGVNSFDRTNVPPGLSNVVAIAAGQDHCLALRSDGTVVGWGSDANGRATPPATASNIAAIAAGWYHSLGAVRSPAAVHLPAGLALSADGVISGMPTQAGTNLVTFVVRDSAGTTTNKTLEIVVQPAPPAPVLSQTAVNVREAGEGRFFVRLDRAPTGNVAVAVSRSEGDAGIAPSGTASLVFKPSNWSTWQAVTLAAPDDANAVGETATFRISAPGAADQFATATALDDDIAENLALASSGATISGTRGYRLADAIDGVHAASTNYAWMSWTNPPKGTMTVDIRSLATVSRIRLLNWDWTYRTHRYKIEASQNGTSWTTLVDASGEDHQGWDDWAVADEQIRYLRLTGLTNSANTGFCVPEWEIYGVRALSEQLEFSKAGVNVREGGEGRIYVRMTSAPPANVAYSVSLSSGDAGIAIQGSDTLTFKPSNWNVWQPLTFVAPADENGVGETATFRFAADGVADQFVTATALDDDIAENLARTGGTTISGYRAYVMPQAIDGFHNAKTNYAYVMWTGTSKGTMTMDLKAVATVSRIRLLNWDWTYRNHGYKIDSSQNGTIWTTLVNVSAGGRQGWDDWAVADEQIRYLRITGFTNSVDNAICIPEWEVYGTRSVGKQSLAAAAAKPGASASDGSVVAESEPVSVLTSDGAADGTGWNAVDGDDATAWVGQKADGGYLVVEYEPTLKLSGLEVVLAGGSLADIKTLYGMDAKEWKPLPEDLESNPVSLRYLWLVFPDDGTDAVPQVLEIVPNP